MYQLEIKQGKGGFRQKEKFEAKKNIYYQANNIKTG